MFDLQKEETVELMKRNFISRVPWGLGPSLKEKTDELGIDFDSFIEAIKDNKDLTAMAEKFNVSEEIIAGLKEHFERLGIQSIVGQD